MVCVTNSAADWGAGGGEWEHEKWAGYWKERTKEKGKPPLIFAELKLYIDTLGSYSSTTMCQYWDNYWGSILTSLLRSCQGLNGNTGVYSLIHVCDLNCLEDKFKKKKVDKRMFSGCLSKLAWIHNCVSTAAHVPINIFSCTLYCRHFIQMPVLRMYNRDIFQ